MKLLTAKLEARFAQIGDQENVDDPIVVCKFFNPQGSGTWLITEWLPEDGVFFGLCHIHEAELGYVSRAELEAFTGRFHLGIERDIHWTEMPLSRARQQECI